MTSRQLGLGLVGALVVWGIVTFFSGGYVTVVLAAALGLVLIRR